MREDMAKVIVERPRVRPYFQGKRTRKRNIDDLPSHEGMLRAVALNGEDIKELNENLSPLRRYLFRQVGRPWNKVFSEIAVRLKPTSTVQQHVRDHVEDFVALDAQYVRHRHVSIVEHLWWQPLFVDPVTGILRRTDSLPEVKAALRAARQKSPAPPAECISIDKDHELRKFEGIWYEARLALLPKAVYNSRREVQKKALKLYERNSPVIEIEIYPRRLVTPPVSDAFTHTKIEVGPALDNKAAWDAFRRKHPNGRYAVAKRALSRRELRRHGISNDVREP